MGSLSWMRSSRVVRAFDCQCKFCNSPGFNLWNESEGWHTKQCRVKNFSTKFKKIPLSKKKSEKSNCLFHFVLSRIFSSKNFFTVYCTLFTIVYLTFKNPLIHQVNTKEYFILVFTLVIKTIFSPIIWLHFGFQLPTRNLFKFFLVQGDIPVRNYYPVRTICTAKIFYLLQTMYGLLVCVIFYQCVKLLQTQYSKEVTTNCNLNRNSKYCISD